MADEESARSIQHVLDGRQRIGVRLDTTMNAYILPPNVLRHFYSGGARIAALRGVELESDHMPEEWIGAVNQAFGAHDGRGLSRLTDGTFVRDAIAAEPLRWLGPDHVARFGADPGLLVKLLDAGERLPVHFHPSRGFGAEFLGSTHGKTESWIIVEAERDAAVHVGFAEPVALDTLRGWMRAQDAAAMLAAMRRHPVAPGDAVLVPAGTPHAIGEGILLVEIQEPTDFSLMLEWDAFELTEADANLGLGWDRALQALDRSAWDDDRLAAIRGPGAGRSLLPAAADPYFRAERVAAGDDLDPGYSVLIGLAGSGTLVTRGGELQFGRGSEVLLPYAAGAAELTGDAEAIRCRPPDPSTAPASAGAPQEMTA